MDASGRAAVTNSGAAVNVVSGQVQVTSGIIVALTSGQSNVVTSGQVQITSGAVTISGNAVNVVSGQVQVTSGIVVALTSGQSNVVTSGQIQITSGAVTISGNAVNVVSGQVQVMSGVLVAKISGESVRFGTSGFSYAHIQGFDYDVATFRNAALTESGHLKTTASVSADISGTTVRIWQGSGHNGVYWKHFAYAINKYDSLSLWTLNR